MDLNEQECESNGKLKITPTATRSSQSTGRRPHATGTSKQSSGNQCQQLTLSAEGSPVNRSVLPGSDEARTMTVTSGQKLCDALALSGPLGSLARMCLGSSTWHSTRCVLTWKVSATPSGRSVYRLVPSMRGTKDSESGLWPTLAVTVTGGPTGLGGGSGNRHKLYRMLGATEGRKLCCGSLNPEWAEWFMGYPIKHTELEDSATPSSRRSRKR